MLFYTSCLILGFILPVLLADNENNQKDGSEENFSEARFDDVIVFGDSFSDTGNVYKLTNRAWPKSPPYYKGRYCNGPNWVDQLKSFGADSYAYGSATTDNNFVRGYAVFYTTLVPGIRQQVATYFSQNNPSKINFQRTLYVLWGGGNDFLENRTLSPPAIVGSLMNSVNDLLTAGAKNILVFNQLPSQYTPLSASLGAPPGALAYLVSVFNTALTGALAPIRVANPQATLSIFDVNLLLTKVITSNSDYFTSTTTNCWNSTNVNTVIQLCPDPNKYVFLDTIHYTAPVQKLIADAIQPFLLNSYAVNSASCYVH